MSGRDRTRTGQVLTDSDIARIAAEVESTEYDVEGLKTRRRGRPPTRPCRPHLVQDGQGCKGVVCAGNLTLLFPACPVPQGMAGLFIFSHARPPSCSVHSSSLGGRAQRALWSKPGRWPTTRPRRDAFRLHCLTQP